MTLRPEDFRFVVDLMREQCAIVLEAGKEYLVETRLHPVAVQSGCADIAALVRALRAQPTGPLLKRVVDAMTTNETSFFRDVGPYEHLKKRVLPELIELRRERKQLSIWSAASSSGQEAYSLAMIVREHFPELASWNVSILATDISQTMLTRARAGVYSQLEVNRGLPAPLLVKYFRRRGIEWQIEDTLRQMIEWREFNLAARNWNLPSFDLVLLRNVMIYFEVPTKRQILSNVRRLLRPDGFLVLGTAETTLNIDEGYAPDVLNSSCYRPRSAA